MSVKTVYLGLGANTGDREANLREAVKRLGVAGVVVKRASQIRETAAMYVVNQPAFLNMAVEGETDVLPKVLLKRLKMIEREMGRKPGAANSPRPIDIDILFYGQFVINDRELTVPHPRLAERPFVLDPMAEIAPDLRHPVLKRTMKQLRDSPQTPQMGEKTQPDSGNSKGAPRRARALRPL